MLEFMDSLYGIKPEYRDVAKVAYDMVLKTLVEGAKTHSDECGFKLSKKEQLEHAMLHLSGEYEGDTSEDHIAHAMARCALIEYTEGK
jgi:hypothetical protein